MVCVTTGRLPRRPVLRYGAPVAAFRTGRNEDPHGFAGRLGIANTLRRPKFFAGGARGRFLFEEKSPPPSFPLSLPLQYPLSSPLSLPSRWLASCLDYRLIRSRHRGHNCGGGPGMWELSRTCPVMRELPSGSRHRSSATVKDNPRFPRQSPGLAFHFPSPLHAPLICCAPGRGETLNILPHHALQVPFMQSSQRTPAPPASPRFPRP